MNFMQPQPAGPSGTTPGRAKRPTWHWLVLGGIGLVGLLVVALVAGVILWTILSRGNPQDTLEDFYSSLRSSDCELFQESTTEDFREAAELSSCSRFETVTSGMTDIDYQINERINRQGYAIFDVTETYQVEGQEVEASLRYYVRRFDGGWYLDGIEAVDQKVVG